MKSSTYCNNKKNKKLYSSNKKSVKVKVVKKKKKNIDICSYDKLELNSSFLPTGTPLGHPKIMNSLRTKII